MWIYWLFLTKAIVQNSKVWYSGIERTFLKKKEFENEGECQKRISNRAKYGHYHSSGLVEEDFLYIACVACVRRTWSCYRFQLTWEKWDGNFVLGKRHSNRAECLETVGVALCSQTVSPWRNFEGSIKVGYRNTDTQSSVFKIRFLIQQLNTCMFISDSESLLALNILVGVKGHF